MENEEYFTEEGLLDEVANDNVDSASPESAVSHESPKEDSLTLAELEAVLGKKFPNKEKALKALRDTNSYVGAKKDKVKEEILQEIGDRFIPADRYHEDMFFARNTQYNTPEIKEVINAMAKANGQSPEQVVNSDTFKRVFDSFSGFEQIQKQKTVLQSNPRIASSKNHLESAVKAAQEGNIEATEKSVVNAVKEAFEL